MAVKTKHITGRRRLHFGSYDELLADARALSRVPTRQLGNWSFDQVCQHLAKAMDTAIDGFTFRPAWYIRLIGPFIRKRFLARPMPAGFRLPKSGSMLLPADAGSEGLAALERSVARMQQNPHRGAHPVFGPMTNGEWDQLQFRHAELHLSFLLPEN